MPDRQRVLLAGYGRLGRELARALPANQYHITALRRRKATGQSIHAAFAGDLTDPASLRGLDKHFDIVIYSPTPDRRKPEAYRKTFCQGLKNLLRRGAPKSGGRLVFVSSTAVYGQNDGSEVDETSATEPTRFNGEILLEAEALARSASDCRTTVVRLGGLYGDSDNYLVRRLLSGEIGMDKLHQWTNRIHLADAAGLIAHWLEHDIDKPLVNGVDDQPALRVDMLTWLAEQLMNSHPSNVLKKQLKPLHKAQNNDEPHTGKRISNQLARSTGYHFRFPDYQTGYASILNAVRNNGQTR